jgi:hypothetical protein
MRTYRLAASGCPAIRVVIWDVSEWDAAGIELDPATTTGEWTYHEFQAESYCTVATYVLESEKNLILIRCGRRHVVWEDRLASCSELRQ